MATGTAPSNPAGPAPRKVSQSTKVIGYDQFIEGQLRKTRSQVKWVDISSAAMTLVAGSLIYLFAVALADHWLVSGGLGFWGRFLALAGLLVCGGYYAARYLLPLLIRRINPVYAAQAIEQTQPSLKNSLVNFLLLRGSREGVAEAVYQAVEQQAASRLSQVHVETAIDRSHLIRVFSVLLGIVTVCCLYTVLSPKNPLRTVGRVIMPWANIDAPTQVTIEQVSPGDTSAFYDGYVDVEAVVRGVSDDEPVTLFYSTADGQAVEQPIVMQRPAGAYRHGCVLPAGTGGLQQTVRYYIAAGDAKSPLYTIEVLPAPSIVVEQVEYRYPKYTGLEPATVGHGDLKALEGTRATLLGTSNQDIARAHVDLDCKGQRHKPMAIDGRQARATLPLRFQTDGKTQEFTTYQIRFTNRDGHENPQPIRHTVEVVRDLPPEAKLVSPEQPQIELPIDGRLQIKVRAHDPDFALSSVEIVAERVDQSGDVLLAEPLLNKEHAGEFEGTFTFEPAKLKLAVGDSVRYWVEARDNRQPDDDEPPQPNRGQSEKYKITIIEARQPPSDRLANNDRKPQQPPEGDPRNKPNDEPQPREGQPQPRDPKQPGAKQEGPQQPGDKSQEGQPQPGDKAGNEGQPGEGKPGEGKPGQNGQRAADQKSADGGEGQPNDAGNQEESQRRIDPMSNPGDAFEEILKQKNQQPQQQDNSKPGQPQDGQQPEQPQDQPPKQPQPKQPGDSGSEKPQGSQEGSPSKPAGSGQQAAGSGQQPSEKPMPGQKPQDGGQPGESQPQGGSDTKNGAQDAKGSQPKSPDNRGQKSPAGSDQKPQGSGSEPGAKEPGDKPAPGEQPQNPEQPGGENAKPMGENKQPGNSAKSPDNGTPQSQEAAKTAQGDGSEVKGAGDPKQKPMGEPGQKPDTQGGDRDNEKGNQGGAGQKGTDDKPSPSTQEKNQVRGEKKQQPDEPGGENGPKDSEAKSPSNSPKQSDSKGGESGDRSGGGKPGGGQTASGVEGTGGPGETTASDQGNKKAPGAGQGETSDQAGNKAPSDKPTGNSDPSGQRGEGSKQQDGSGEQPGGQQAGPGKQQQDGQKSSDAGQKGQRPMPGQQQPNAKNQPGGETPPDGNQADPSQQSGDSAGGGGTPTGGHTRKGEPDNQGDPSDGDGQAGENRNPPPPREQDPAGDAANLEYAKKATDLALEHLKDQLDKGQPDQELLDKLKWSREDMQRFVDHWERMKREAQTPGPAGNAARQRLEESLRSLGLRPQGTSLKSSTAGGDEQRGLRASRRTSPPAEYADQVKAYKQRLAKGQRDKQ